MQGYHETKAFPVGVALPPGWKPFAYENGQVIARKWVRLETPNQPSVVREGLRDNLDVPDSP